MFVRAERLRVQGSRGAVGILSASVPCTGGSPAGRSEVDISDRRVGDQLAKSILTGGSSEIQPLASTVILIFVPLEIAPGCVKTNLAQ
mgnify:CR=1 FL=1